MPHLIVSPVPMIPRFHDEGDPAAGRRMHKRFACLHIAANRKTGISITNSRRSQLFTAADF
jgi:hypothetical protein